MPEDKHIESVMTLLLLLPLTVVAHELGGIPLHSWPVVPLPGILCRLPKDAGYECGLTSSHSAYHFDIDIGSPSLVS